MEQRSRVLFVLITLMMLVVLPSCGSSSGNHGLPPNPGTPTGTSNVTVTAKSGTTVSTTGFTLIVQ